MATIPENLRLVLDHLNAARELDRYFRKKSVYKDLERYTKDVVVPSLLQRLPTLASWESDLEENCAEWFPDGWALGDDLCVSVYLDMQNPVEPDVENSLPSVSLCVPGEWAGRKLFRGSSPAWHRELTKAEFQYIEDHEDGDDEFLFVKSLNWLKEDGAFDEDDLMERIAKAMRTLVQLEPMIGESIREVCLKCPPKKQTKQRQSKQSRKSK
jgi:hypothetical protein